MWWSGRFADRSCAREDVLSIVEHLAHELAHLLERHRRGRAAFVQVALVPRPTARVLRDRDRTGEAGARFRVRIRRLFIDRLAVLAERNMIRAVGFDVRRLLRVSKLSGRDAVTERTGRRP